jgi:multidrug efflux system membrane fusion protein
MGMTRLSVTVYRHKRFAVVAAAVALGTGLILTGCAKEGAASSAGKPAGMAAPVPVNVATALQKDVPIDVRVIGTVEPYSTVTIKSRVAGQIVKVGFQRGQDVKKGDLLFEIDRRPFEAALAAAKANLARDIATAKNARQEAEFQEDIFKRGAGAQREFDRALAAAEAAEAQVEADKAAVRNAQVQLDYCTIASPLDGRTGDLMVYEGSVVKNDDTSLVTINQIAPIYVSFSVAERYLPQIRQYMAAIDKPLTVDVTFPQANVPAEQGELTFVDNQVDRTTGMIQLKGTFDNDNRVLWPGQFVNVALVLTTLPDAVVVPSQAVQTGQRGQFVFVVKPDNTVESRTVTTGPIWNDLTVIEKGIAANDAVVTDGQLRLAPGARITVKNAPGTQPSQAEATAKVG